MASLRKCDPELRKYLMKHRLPDVIESIFTALVVNKPESPPKFIIEKIDKLQSNPDLWIDLRWDTFIDEEKKPKYKFNADFLDFLWSYEDDSLRPTVEMNCTAYTFYNTSLMVMCFRSLKRYWLHKKKEKEKLQMQMQNSRVYFKHRVQRVHFMGWRAYTKVQLEKKKVLFEIISKVFSDSLVHIVFDCWRKVVLDSKRTREYFEKLERGELERKVTREEKEVKDLITTLPKKLAVMIFSFIDLPDLVSCSQVCRSWKVITQVNVLWSRIDLTKMKDRFSNAFVANMIHKGRSFLCHLNIRGVNGISVKSLKTIGECRNLQDLNIADCKHVTDEVIKEIAIGCSSLLYLNISQSGISDAALKWLSRYCNNIQFLNVANCHNFSEKGLHYLANGKGCSKLLYLDLSGCDQINSQGYYYVSSGCKRISSLVLNGLPLLNDDSIKAYMAECKTLRSFCCLNSPLLTDAAFHVVMSCKKLHTVKIEGNSRITDASVKIMVKSCPELRHVYLANCIRLSDLALKALGQCRNLIVLNVADCFRLSDVGVRHLVEGPSGQNIRELNLTNCVRVSDVSLLRIAQRCHSLNYANFSYCEHITDAGVELIGTMSGLMSIDISGCNVQDNGVASLGNNEKLKYIVLSECILLSDIGLQKLFQKTRNLENLDISQCKLVTDQAMKSLAFYCRKIRRLNVAGCKLLTDSSIQFLSGSCHYLERLDISGCRGLSDKSMRYLRKGCRNLYCLTMLFCRGITKSMGHKMQTKLPHVFYSQDEATAPVRFHGISQERLIVNY